jgi:GrpB-like predicted nucleotidyltransferase (UPF0157 family)
MLTTKQEKWINHLREDNQIIIRPFDPKAKEKFELVKQKIQFVLGETIQVLHRGASSLGISGQDEIDVYIPVPEARFDHFVAEVTKIFGEARSHYPLERTRFVTEEFGKHIDVFVINETGEGWTDSEKFDRELRGNPKILEEYRKLKESGHGLNCREYYRRKTEFINKVLQK